MATQAEFDFTKFQVGQTYYARFICAYNNIATVEVVRMTDKSIWIEYMGEVKRKVLRKYEDEQIFRLGTLSFSSKKPSALLPDDAYHHNDY